MILKRKRLFKSEIKNKIESKKWDEKRTNIGRIAGSLEIFTLSELFILLITSNINMEIIAAIHCVF